MLRRLLFVAAASLALLRLEAADVAVIYDGQHVAPGVEYFHQQTPSVPWSIYVTRIDRRQNRLELITTMPTNHAVGLTSTTEQMKAIPGSMGEPLVAINGDFFSWRKGPYQGDPAGLQITEGELVSAPVPAKGRTNPMLDGVAFCVDRNGQLHLEKVFSDLSAKFSNGFRLPLGLNQERTNNTAALYTEAAGTSTRMTNGLELILEDASGKWLPFEADQVYRARVRRISHDNSSIDREHPVLSIGPKLLSKLPKLTPGSIVEISTATSPSIKGTETAIGGGPWLVHAGKARRFKNPKRDPRSAVGFNDRYVFFVVVDGRRPGISLGMSFDELAEEMVSLGCTEAMNLDGGGSATMWVKGAIMNQPSDNHERAVANDLVLVLRAKH